ncbi:hypothetical protein BDW74DRAFT_175556 [Aspergillus multicolor]|uniref:uncharacterized protein n=1 Tax=Aspergillus multicolor TaxID=41759 RepID=UPI003CCCFEC1
MDFREDIAIGVNTGQRRKPASTATGSDTAISPRRTHGDGVVYGGDGNSSQGASAHRTVLLHLQ